MKRINFRVQEIERGKSSSVFLEENRDLTIVITHPEAPLATLVNMMIKIRLNSNFLLISQHLIVQVFHMYDKKLSGNHLQ